jgi:hypothetical protein
VINWHGVCTAGETLVGSPPLQLGPGVTPEAYRRAVEARLDNWKNDVRAPCVAYVPAHQGYVVRDGRGCPFESSTLLHIRSSEPNQPKVVDACGSQGDDAVGSSASFVVVSCTRLSIIARCCPYTSESSVQGRSVALQPVNASSRIRRRPSLIASMIRRPAGVIAAVLIRRS